MIGEFVGLKSRMDSMKNIDGKEANTAKGVCVATEFKKFKNLSSRRKQWDKIKRIQAKNHKLGTYEIKKISLSCFNDKRSASKDVIHTRAYFHKDLRKKIKKSFH